MVVVGAVIGDSKGRAEDLIRIANFVQLSNSQNHHSLRGPEDRARVELSSISAQLWLAMR